MKLAVNVRENVKEHIKETSWKVINYIWYEKALRMSQAAAAAGLDAANMSKMIEILSFLFFFSPPLKALSLLYQHFCVKIIDFNLKKGNGKKNRKSFCTFFSLSNRTSIVVSSMSKVFWESIEKSMKPFYSFQIVVSFSGNWHCVNHFLADISSGSLVADVAVSNCNVDPLVNRFSWFQAQKCMPGPIIHIKFMSQYHTSKIQLTPSGWVRVEPQFVKI